MLLASINPLFTKTKKLKKKPTHCYPAHLARPLNHNIQKSTSKNFDRKNKKTKNRILPTTNRQLKKHKKGSSYNLHCSELLRNLTALVASGFSGSFVSYGKAASTLSDPWAMLLLFKEWFEVKDCCMSFCVLWFFLGVSTVL